VRTSVSATLVLVGLAGCTNPYDREGSEPYECRDGADNDEDGYYDCDDNGCWDSPDCDGGGDDTGHDTGDTNDNDTNDTDTNDTDTNDTGNPDTGGPCTTFVCDFETLDVTLTIDYDAPDGLCSDLFPACDCVLVYEGSGTFDNGSGWRGTFGGKWRLASVTPDTPACQTYSAGVWRDEVTEDAYHSVHFTSGGGMLDTWVVHSTKSGVDPIFVASDAMAAGQYSVWDMQRTYSASTNAVTHTESFTWSMEGLVEIQTDLTAQFTFDAP